MNEQQAIEAAQQAEVPLGESITVQNEGMIDNPHSSPSTGYEHTDAWIVTHNLDGSWTAEKEHAPY